MQITYISRSRLIFNYVLLIVSLMVSVAQGFRASSVQALSPSLLVTPVPTLTPIGDQPTAIPLGDMLDYSCPAGVPAGYGTVTPSTDWLYACGGCLPTYTPQAFYTSTPGPTHTPAFTIGDPINHLTLTAQWLTGTPTPTSTVTPIVTPTLTPVGYGGSDYLTCGLYCIQDNSYTVRSEQTFSGLRVGYGQDLTHLNYTRSSLSSYMYHWYYYDITFVNNPTIYNPKTNFSTVGSSSVPTFNVWLANYEFSGASSFRLNFSGLSHEGTYSASVGTGLTDYLAVDPYSGHTSSGYLLYGTVKHIVTLDPSYNPFFVPTLTPTPTATGTLDPRYCGSISSSNVPNQFSLSGGRIVRQKCMTTTEFVLRDVIASIFPYWMPSFLITEFLDLLNSLVPIDFSFDPLTVCIRERDYSLYLFGYRMPIEVIVGFAIFLSGVRFWVPSALSGASVVGQGVHSSHDGEKSGKKK